MMTNNFQKRKSSYVNRIGAFLFSGFLSLCLVGCSLGSNTETKPSEKENADTGFVVYGPGDYDSADTPVLVEKDAENKTMTFLNLDLGRTYTLEYDGTSCFYDKYGAALSLSQINIGDMVDVKFIKSKKHLTSMQLSSTSWSIDNTNRYIINPIKKEVTIGEDTYKISSDARYFSEGKEIQQQDLIDTDTLTFSGIGNNVYSVVVENGHGYLKVTGQENFVGGWIEVGNSIIKRVSEDMMLTVPEGNYQVKISFEGTTAEKNVMINRNSESSVDFSDVVFEDPKTGLVLFSVNPTGAKLYIDGELTDITSGVTLTYGIHQLICKADGYTTVTQYLNVGQASAGIDITLEKATDDSDESDGSASDSNTDTTGNDTDSSTGTDSNDSAGDSATSNTDSAADTSTSTDSSENSDGSGTGSGDSGNAAGNTTDNSAEGSGNAGNSASSGGNTNTTSTYYKVYIDSPEGVEVYIDGSYVGVSPCSFKKVEGSHIVTLCKEGYTTRSYTISVDSEDKDVSFSFVALVAVN